VSLVPTETPPQGYTHEALFFGSQKDLVDAATPFIAAGLDAGDDVVMACTETNNDALLEAVGRDRVTRLRREELYQHAPSALAAYRGFVERRLSSGASGVRLVGEVDFGAEPRSWREWARFEALCNQAMASFPLWSLCVYDTAALSEEVLGHGRRTHPHLRRGDDRTLNPAYLEPHRFLDQLGHGSGDGLEAADPALALHDVADLAVVRKQVKSELLAAGADPAVVEDFVLAVNEVSTNAMRHGRPPVDVCLWTADEVVVCRVTDHGTGAEDPLTIYYSPTGEELPQERMGLWLVRQLCDDFTFSRSPAGFTVRLATRLRPSERLGAAANGHR
jgi:anti-sigma regulatory factor (Ser/Thr protein kinase)